MEYKTRKWHDKCFQCVVCKSLVGSKPFIIPNETDVYCVGCFEEKFATKCTKCKKIMTTGGVTFKNEVSRVTFNTKLNHKITTTIPVIFHNLFLISKRSFLNYGHGQKVM